MKENLEKQFEFIKLGLSYEHMWFVACKILKRNEGMGKNLENKYGVYIVPLCKGLDVHKCPCIIRDV